MGVLIIAEAGVNHNGDIHIAEKLVAVAAQAGADVIKFQTFNPNLMVAKTAQKASYQIQGGDKYESQYEMLCRLALPHNLYSRLIDCCKYNGIEFMSTPFDMESIDFLCSLNVERMKIPSGEITNLPYLIKIANTGKKIILSSGMSTMDELMEAIDVLKKNGAGEITVLHCTTEYPTPFCDVNLRVISTIRQELKLPVGYSDHTLGIEVPIAAVALGSDVVEKHFTLDKKMDGPDHKASLEPHELTAMVRAIRNIEQALGTTEKLPAESEKKNLNVVRKSIVAKRQVAKSEFFTEENISVKRPGNGVSPMQWYNVLGTQAIRNFEEDELIEI